MLFLLSVQFTGSIDDIVQVTSGKFSVVMVFVIFGYIEINGTLTLVGITVLQNFLYQLNLLDNVSGSVRFNAGW